MPDFKLQVALWRHTDTAEASRVQITPNRRELNLPRQLVQVCGSRIASEKSECAICFDVLCCPEEGVPGCQCKTGTHRNSANTKVGQGRKRELMVKTRDEHVDGFRRECFYNLRNLARITNA